MLREKPDKINLYRLFFIGLLFTISLSALAQNNFRHELSLGVNGGTTISTVNFKTSKFAIRESRLIQSAGGLSVRFISEKNIGILGEINYSQRGWGESKLDDPDFHYSRQLNYLEVPVMTHIYFDAGKHFRVVFNLGPQVGYYLYGKDLKRNFTYPPNDDADEHLYNNPNTRPYINQKIERPFDWGLCFGGGVEFRTSMGNFVLDGRYYFGLSDIFNNSKADYFASSSNQVIGVKLTYLFDLRAKN